MNQSDRLKSLRRKAGLNQQQVAAYIGKSRSRLAIYETQPSLQIPYPVLQKLADLYKSTPEFIEQGLETPRMAPETTDKVSGKNVRPLVVTVDSTGKENILFVPVKARAGYLLGYGDPEYIQSLYACSMPGFTNGTFRIFEVEGYSMTNTLQPGDMVITRYVENWNNLSNDNVYVIVAKNGICIKRIQNVIDKAAGIVIQSDNPEFATDFIPVEDILEIWEARALVSKSVSRKPSDVIFELNTLKSRFEHLTSKKPA
ncbi:LexA family transcriptional regulator [Rhodocytophaga aerolata]|uniref:LexA family transcriptional regulator n=1 Tax=Rhodocytophaga aerolata TaxID=455078 RepID=A0ABT8R6T0_9BACT|nr:LexA family transcriptional regulator [Rhodocytophaga aerolata]MDO1447810.1 LexA family transcriptional regulator [Rhodocytophaga aerolata]